MAAILLLATLLCFSGLALHQMLMMQQASVSTCIQAWAILSASDAVCGSAGMAGLCCHLH